MIDLHDQLYKIKFLSYKIILNLYFFYMIDHVKFLKIFQYFI